jgi:SOS-response transcriptional repressor LexA
MADRIHAFVQLAVVVDGKPPSVRRIMRAMGLHSPRAVQYHLARLVGEKRLWPHDGKYWPTMPRNGRDG